MLPLHLQPQSHVPLYIQLRDQLRALVHAGDLRQGDRIPASRELATMLGVHRTTVANAYAELESEGLIQGHVGRGTFIKGNGNGLKITPPAPPVLNGNGGIRWELLFADERGEEILSRLTANVPEGALSFVMACPAEEFFPIEELQTCVNAVLRREGAEVLNLGPSDGYPPLKAALLEVLHHDGIAAKDENLLITDGCQQSFDLISKAFVRPGDSVIMENPTYPGAVAIFHGARARCLSVPMRTHPEPGTTLGLDLEALVATLAANQDWAHVAVLENLPITDQRMRANLIASHGGPDVSVVITSARSSTYSMRVEAPRYTIVASSIPWWPGWHVRADGRRVTPLRINGAFVGFLLPPGDHDVQVWYAPWSFRLGVCLSLVTMLALGFAACRDFHLGRVSRITPSHRI